MRVMPVVIAVALCAAVLLWTLGPGDPPQVPESPRASTQAASQPDAAEAAASTQRFAASAPQSRPASPASLRTDGLPVFTVRVVDAVTRAPCPGAEVLFTTDPELD